MRFLRPIVLALAVCCLGFGERPPELTVRFYAEANPRDGESFSSPIKVGTPPRDTFLQKMPSVHEGQITAIYPFQTPDGTWGCTFKLDANGRINLDVVSTDHRGKFLIGFIGNKRGTVRVADLLIDKTVTDGILTVPRGLTDMQIMVLKQQFKVWGGDPNPVSKKKPVEWPFRKKDAEAS